MTSAQDSAPNALRVEIDETTCQGIGYCARLCPSAFKVDVKRRMAVVLTSEVSDPALMQLVEEAEQTCPTRAIMVTPIRKD